MKLIYKAGLWVLLLSVTVLANAQEETYRGGISDGHSSGLLLNFTTALITKQAPFGGGMADGVEDPAAGMQVVAVPDPGMDRRRFHGADVVAGSLCDVDAIGLVG